MFVAKVIGTVVASCKEENIVSQKLIELRVITAVIIGGGSLAGGRGTVLGAFMGALFMGILNNVMVIAGVNVYFQSIAIGCVLLGAVSMDVILLKKYGGRES